jgi:hypothetical protein
MIAVTSCQRNSLVFSQPWYRNLFVVDGNREPPQSPQIRKQGKSHRNEGGGTAGDAEGDCRAMR